MDKVNTHIVIKREDVQKYLSKNEQQTLDQLLEVVRNGRSSDGKKPTNTYYICNTDESYAEKVLNVIMRAEYDKAYQMDMRSDESQRKAVEDNWNELYNLANRFLESLDIHYHVKRKRIVLKGGPMCYVDIPVKDNKDIFVMLEKLSCTIKCKEFVADGVKYAEYGLVMNKVKHLLSEGEEFTLCPGNNASINILDI